MSSGLLREGLCRGSNRTQTIAPAPAAESAGGSEKGSVSNVTYVSVAAFPRLLSGSKDEAKTVRVSLGELVKAG
jgi:hypothetical protein